MIKTRWVRNAAVFGTAVTLSLACVGVTTDSTAASFCQETDMAGLSLSLDKYYTENYVAPKEVAAVDNKETATATSEPAEEKQDTEEKRKEATIAKQFHDLAVADVDDYVNVRKKPTTDSKVLGKLERGASAEIIGEEGKWLKVKFGDLTGYVKKDFVSNVSGYVNIRKKATTESKVVGRLESGASADIIGEEDGWVKVKSGNVTGFVRKDLLAIDEKTEEKKETAKKETTKKETTKKETAKEKDTEEKSTEATVTKQFRDLGIADVDDYVNIRKKPTTDSKILGKLYRGSSAKIIGEKDGWVKIESGSVTGFIRKDLLAIGEKAEKLAGKYGTAYAIVKSGTVTLNVRSKKSTKSSIVTQVAEEEKFEIIGESNNWYKISVDGDTRGYVAKEFTRTHVNFKKAISIKEEQEALRRKQEAERAEQERLAALAEEQAAAEQSSSDSSSSSSSSSNSSSSNSSSSNSSSSNSSYSNNSNSSSSNSSSSSSNSSSSSSSSSSSNSAPAVPSGSSGSAVASYACKFVGRPYVWGGTSLTNGADCSGFTMSVYAQFGYSLPHSSAAQAGYGKSVSLSNLQPGDLLFYKNGGRIGHVAIYIGGGSIVHASNAKDGIKISNYNYRQPACARRIIG